jgi:ketosteroid isomerase-like protein
MGSPNVAVVEAFFDAISSRDVDAIEALSHPEVEVDATAIGADLGRYTGRAGMVRYFEDLWSASAEMSARVVETIEAGDRVAAVVDIRVRGAASGVVVEGRYGAWYELRGGLIAIARVFPSLEAALADAGIAR